MFLSTSRRSREPASAVSMKGKSSNTRKSRTRAKRQQKTSRPALILAGHSPTNHCGFDAFVSIEALPGAIARARHRNGLT